MYRALLRIGRSLDAGPLRIRLPVARSKAQWMGGSQQFGFVSHRSAVREIFPGIAASDANDVPELSPSAFRDVIRAEFRRALAAQRDGGSGSGSSVLDEGLHALKELHAQLDLARRSSSVLSKHAPTGAAVVVEATSELQGRDSEQWVFQYRIRIANVGTTPVQLVGRSWVIKNSDGTVHASVPRGSPGVVGQTPRLEPGGEAFEYASGTALATPGGTVEGSFQMVSLPGDGPQQSFDATVGKFECVVDSGHS